MSTAALAFDHETEILNSRCYRHSPDDDGILGNDAAKRSDFNRDNTRDCSN